MEVLAKSVDALLRSTTLQAARPGGYVPAFSLKYKDSTPMVTVGGFFTVTRTSRLVDGSDTRARVGRPLGCSDHDATTDRQRSKHASSEASPAG